MEPEKYIKCPYCSNVFNYDENHPPTCTSNYCNEQILWCFGCGESNKKYSNSQLKKEDKARCYECVLGNKIDKYQLYDYLCYNYSDKIQNININRQLKHYIGALNLDATYELLLAGANPNYKRQQVFQPNSFYCYLLYNADGTECTEEDDEQPTTPLKLAVFRFSDCCLEEKDKFVIIEIAKLLIRFGANKEEARKYYEMRYGIPNKYEGLWFTLYMVLSN